MGDFVYEGQYTECRATVLDCINIDIDYKC